MVISEVKPKFEMYDFVPPKNGNQKRLNLQRNRQAGMKTGQCEGSTSARGQGEELKAEIC